jgi:hypothetical protein
LRLPVLWAAVEPFAQILGIEGGLAEIIGIETAMLTIAGPERDGPSGFG